MTRGRVSSPDFPRCATSCAPAAGCIMGSAETFWRPFMRSIHAKHELWVRRSESVWSFTLISNPVHREGVSSSSPQRRVRTRTEHLSLPPQWREQWEPRKLPNFNWNMILFGQIRQQNTFICQKTWCKPSRIRDVLLLFDRTLSYNPDGPFLWGSLTPADCLCPHARATLLSPKSSCRLSVQKLFIKCTETALLWLLLLSPGTGRKQVSAGWFPLIKKQLFLIIN